MLGHLQDTTAGLFNLLAGLLTRSVWMTPPADPCGAGRRAAGGAAGPGELCPLLPGDAGAPGGAQGRDGAGDGAGAAVPLVGLG